MGAFQPCYSSFNANNFPKIHFFFNKHFVPFLKIHQNPEPYYSSKSFYYETRCSPSQYRKSTSVFPFNLCRIYCLESNGRPSGASGSGLSEGFSHGKSHHESLRIRKLGRTSFFSG